MAFLGVGGVASILGIAGDAVGKVVDHYFPDPQKAAEFKLEIYKSLQASDLAQIDVNKSEASSSSIFVAGWRPFIGWVCGVSLAYQYVALPISIYIATLVNEHYATVLLNAPKLDDNLWQLLLGMLGMGALRSFDKFQGTAK